MSYDLRAAYLQALKDLNKLSVLNADLLISLVRLVDAARRANSWSDGGSSPYASNDIGDCHDAIEAARAVIAKARG